MADDNLEEYADADRYDRQVTGEDGVAFYLGLARETGGPVLEIACGTGRVGIPIARAGFLVTGLDLVPAMLERARAKSAGLPVRWVEGDARRFDLEGTFRLIFLTGNAFQAFLTRVDQEALLERVRAHLDHDGLFAFETRNPRWPGLSEGLGTGEATHIDEAGGLFALLVDSTTEEPGQAYIDAEGRRVEISLSQRYDHVAQQLHWTSRHRWREGGRTHSRTSRIAVRFTFPQELDALLHYNGFVLERRYGDWDLSPLRPDSPSIIVVCRKRR